MCRLLLGFAGSAVLMGLMMFGHPLFAGNMFLMDVLMLVIATPILMVCAYPIFRQGISQLRGGMLGMEVMYMLGIATSYLAGLGAVLGLLPSPDFLLFETAVMLTALLGLGWFLESRARGRTSDAIMALCICVLRLRRLFVTECSGLRMRQCGILLRSCWVLRFWCLCTGSSLRGRRF